MLSKLFALFFALVSLSCGSDGGTYFPSTDSGNGDTGLDLGQDNETIPAVDITGIPDWSDVVLHAPSAQRLMILSPSVAPSFAVSTGVVDGSVKPSVVLSGVVVGGFQRLLVRVEGQEDVEVELPEGAGDEYVYYFSIPPLTLDAAPALGTGGEYVATSVLVEVVAETLEGEISDSARIVCNTQFEFPGRLERFPEAAFSGETGTVVFTLDLNQVENFDPTQVVLMETDLSCTQKVGILGSFSDDGDNLQDGSGDELPLDRIYTIRASLDSTPAGIRMFRAVVKTQAGGETLWAYTPCTPVFVVPRTSVTTCENHLAILQEGQALYDDLQATEHAGEEARRMMVAWLEAQAPVAQAGSSTHSDLVWLRFGSGILGALQPTPSSGNFQPLDWGEPVAPPVNVALPSSRLAVLSSLSPVDDWETMVDELGCPPLQTLADASMFSGLRQLDLAGLALLGHGGAGYFGMDWEGVFPNWEEALAGGAMDPANQGMDVLWTKEPVVCQQLESQNLTCFRKADGTCFAGLDACPDHLECLITHTLDKSPMGFLYDHTQADLAMGRLVMGPGTWGISSAFIASAAGTNHGPDFVWLGNPGTADSLSMALEFLKAGANSVVVRRWTKDPVEPLADGVSLVNHLASTGTVPMDKVVGIKDTSESGFRLLGPGTLDLSTWGLLNPSFSTGTLKAWTHSGDARALSWWCGNEAADKEMLLISTGIGYVVQTGEISQQFCLGPDDRLFSANYQFISHEFVDSCGGDYDDRMEVFLTGRDGQVVPLVKTEKLDYFGLSDFCPCDAGVCGECEECGSPDCDCGVLFSEDHWEQWPSNCAVDNGDAWSTGWRQAGPSEVVKPGGDGVPVTLTIRVSDRGDAQGATTVLLDGVTLQAAQNQ